MAAPVPSVHDGGTPDAVSLDAASSSEESRAERARSLVKELRRDQRPVRRTVARTVVVPPHRPDGKVRQRRYKRAGRELATIEDMRDCVALRVRGYSFRAIDEDLQLSPGTAQRKVEEWVTSQTPTANQTEVLRATMLERLEELHRVYWPMATGVDDVELAPDQKAAEFVLKVMDREAQLTGVDLQPSPAAVVVVTAESIAGFLGWDGNATPEVIEVGPRAPSALLLEHPLAGRQGVSDAVEGDEDDAGR